MITFYELLIKIEYFTFTFCVCLGASDRWEKYNVGKIKEEAMSVVYSKAF